MEQFRLRYKGTSRAHGWPPATSYFVVQDTETPTGKEAGYPWHINGLYGKLSGVGDDYRRAGITYLMSVQI